MWLAPTIVGRDPRASEALVALMYAIRRQAIGGVIQQAIGAIENALVGWASTTSRSALGGPASRGVIVGPDAASGIELHEPRPPGPSGRAVILSYAVAVWTAIVPRARRR